MFYSYFAELCDKKGVSVNKACKEMGLSRSVAAKWKSTDTQPSMNTLYKISEYFNVSIDDLLVHSQAGQKENPVTGSDEIKNEMKYFVSEKDYHFMQWFRSLSSENQKAILTVANAPQDVS